MTYDKYKLGLCPDVLCPQALCARLTRLVRAAGGGGGTGLPTPTDFFTKVRKDFWNTFMRSVFFIVNYKQVDYERSLHTFSAIAPFH